jgi:ElaB/YqjD/DUF883 family membrane-anchored ribosome-binding protein
MHGIARATFVRPEVPLIDCNQTIRSTEMARNIDAESGDQIKDQAFSELQALIEESEKLLNSAASLAGEEGETLRAQIKLRLKQARDAMGSVTARTKPVVEATQSYIGGHPWQTVALCAGLGAAVGWLLARRN